VTSALRRFSAWLAAQGEPLPDPSAITRALLECFLAHIGADPGIGQPRRRSIIVDLKLFLDDVRQHGWAPGLAGTATYHRGELPREPQPLPRYIDEFALGQLEADVNLARLPDQTTLTAVRLLMETGLRSVNALRLPLDPITRDQAGSPYLVYTNHQLAREAVIPISERVLAEITRQQAELRARWPAPPPWLFPRPWQNADGRCPLGGGALNRRLKRWLADCDIRDADVQPASVTAHQFRHTVGTRLVNNHVPFEIVRRLLDHNSGAMTARYARVKDATLRREWEAYQQRINIRGEIIALDPDGPISDAAWAKENLARAKQTLPNGYCGLPLQQSCPHPNACLTCDSFLTTAQFLDQHRDQLTRTERLIAEAEANGRQRLVEMNEPVRLNLIHIIDGLEPLERGDAR
jgi:integrase